MTDNSITIDEWIESREAVASQRPQLKGHSNEEPLLYVNLHSSGMKFPFQCSCGVKHQFYYTETPEGFRLELLLS